MHRRKALHVHKLIELLGATEQPLGQQGGPLVRDAALELESHRCSSATANKPISAELFFQQDTDPPPTRPARLCVCLGSKSHTTIVKRGAQVINELPKTHLPGIIKTDEITGSSCTKIYQFVTPSFSKATFKVCCAANALKTSLCRICSHLHFS